MNFKTVVTAATTTLMSVGGVIAFTAGPAQAVNTCSVTPKSGVSSVVIRSSKSTSGANEGSLASGKYLGSYCQAQTGGYYSACGGGDQWFEVSYGLFSRYVATSCVRLIVTRD